MSEVFFKKISYEGLLKDPKVLLDSALKSGALGKIKKNDFTALKIHFGEQGNKSHINPNFIIPLARYLRSELKAKPFLFETNTLYHGQRMNAIDHINLAYGHEFGKLNIPVIIGDGIKGNDYMEVKIDKKYFKECYVAAGLKDVDFLLTLSHFTGHMLTGFGCALKNLGMGCAARRGKLAQHCMVSPTIVENRCVSCGACAKKCSVNAIEKGAACYVINKEKCIGCAQCLSSCPNAAVNIVWSQEYDTISRRMVEYAYAATNGRRCAYINFGLYITQECDCMNKDEKSFVPDLGLFFSTDPVAIDKACVDMLIKNNAQDPIKQMHPQINYLAQLDYAQELGMGSMEYNLVEI
jgi:uncharacterized Fe-S center protein